MSDKADAGEKKAGGGIKKLMLPIIVIVILIAGVGVGKMMGGGGKTKKKEAPKMGEIVELDEFLVNLQNDHYLRVTIGLGLKEGVHLGGGGHGEGGSMANIRNAIIMTISGRRMEDLISREGKEKLARDIKHAVNAEMAKSHASEHEEPSEDEEHDSKKKSKDDEEHGDEEHDDGHGKKKNSKKSEKSEDHESEDEESHDESVLEVYYAAFAMQ